MDTTLNIDKNEVKKELYKSKENAKFAYYAAGNLNYSIAVLGGVYQFPISTVEFETKSIQCISSETVETIKVYKVTKLSSDLGTTPFHNEMKGSELNRWIGKAIDKGEFIKVG